MKKQLINIKQAINRSNATGDLGAIMRVMNKLSTNNKDHEYFELESEYHEYKLRSKMLS